MAYQQVSPDGIRYHQSNNNKRRRLSPAPHSSALRHFRREPHYATSGFESSRRDYTFQHPATPDSLATSHFNPYPRHPASGFRTRIDRRDPASQEGFREHHGPMNSRELGFNEGKIVSDPALDYNSAAREQPGCPPEYLQHKQPASYKQPVGKNLKRAYAEEFPVFASKIRRVESNDIHQTNHDDYKKPRKSIESQPRNPKEPKQLNTEENPICISDDEDKPKKLNIASLSDFYHQHHRVATEDKPGKGKPKEESIVPFMPASQVSSYSLKHEDTRTIEVNRPVRSSGKTRVDNAAVDEGSQGESTGFVRPKENTNFINFHQQGAIRKKPDSPIWKVPNQEPCTPHSEVIDFSAEFYNPLEAQFSPNTESPIAMYKNEQRHGHEDDLFVRDTPPSVDTPRRQSQGRDLSNMQEGDLFNSKKGSSGDCTPSLVSQGLDFLSETHRTQTLEDMGSKIMEKHQDSSNIPTISSSQSSGPPLGELLCRFDPHKSLSIQNNPEESSKLEFSNGPNAMHENDSGILKNVDININGSPVIENYTATTVEADAENFLDSGFFESEADQELVDRGSPISKKQPYIDDVGHSRSLDAVNQKKASASASQNENRNNDLSQSHSLNSGESDCLKIDGHAAVTPLLTESEKTENNTVSQALNSKKLESKQVDGGVSGAGDVHPPTKHKIADHNRASAFVSDNGPKGDDKYDSLTSKTSYDTSNEKAQEAIKSTTPGTRTQTSEQLSAVKPLAEGAGPNKASRHPDEGKHSKDKGERKESEGSVSNSDAQTQEKQSLKPSKACRTESYRDKRPSWNPPSAPRAMTMDYSTKQVDNSEKQQHRPCNSSTADREYGSQTRKSGSGPAMGSFSKNSKNATNDSKSLYKPLDKHQHRSTTNLPFIKSAPIVVRPIVREPNGLGQPSQLEKEELRRSLSEKNSQIEEMQVLGCDEAMKLIGKPRFSKEQSEAMQQKTNRSDRHSNKNGLHSNFRAPVANMTGSKVGQKQGLGKADLSSASESNNRLPVAKISQTKKQISAAPATVSSNRTSVADTHGAKHQTSSERGNIQSKPADNLGSKPPPKQLPSTSRNNEPEATSTSLDPISLSSFVTSSAAQRRQMTTVDRTPNQPRSNHDSHSNLASTNYSHNSSYPASANHSHKSSCPSGSYFVSASFETEKEARRERKLKPIPKEQVTEHDWLLVGLYKQGYSWATIRQKWVDETGINRCRESLSQRHKRMHLTYPNDVPPAKSAIYSQQKVGNQVPNRDSLPKRRVEASSCLSGSKGTGRFEQSRPDHQNPRQGETPAEGNGIAPTEKGTSFVLQKNVQPDMAAQDEDASQVDEYEIESGTSSVGDFEREHSPIQEDDRTHYIYVVERRVYHENEFDSIEKRSGKGWRVVSRQFTNAAEASNAAFENMKQEYEDEQPSLWPLVEWGCICDKDHNKGLPEWVGRNQEGYRVEVKVKRSLNTWHDGKLPKDKTGWLPKYVWDVWERRTEMTILDNDDVVVKSNHANSFSSTETASRIINSSSLSETASEIDNSLSSSETSSGITLETNNVGETMVAGEAEFDTTEEEDLAKAVEDISKLLGDSDDDDHDDNFNRVNDNSEGANNTQQSSRKQPDSGANEQDGANLWPESSSSGNSNSHATSKQVEHDSSSSSSSLSGDNPGSFSSYTQIQQRSHNSAATAIASITTTTTYRAVGAIYHLLDRANRAAGKRSLELRREFLIPENKRRRIDTVEKMQQWDREMEQRLDELEKDEAVFEEEEIVKDAEVAVPEIRDYTGIVVQRGGHKRVSVSVGVVKRVLETPRNF